ncbi:MAG: fibronectin type III domain-containing protein [bacterium]
MKRLKNLLLILMIVALFAGCAKNNPVTEIAPVADISSVEVIDITDSGATVTWVTNEPANSNIEYGHDTNYYAGVFNSKYVTSHRIVLYGLTGTTTYHFELRGATVDGDLLLDTDRTFMTN